MPRKKSAQSSNSMPTQRRQRYALPSEAPWGGFINIRLTEPQVEQYRAWETEFSSDAARLLDEMLGAGVKVSLSYDAEHEAYVIAVTGALCSFAATDRYTSTSRAGTLPEAIALTVWKHFWLVEGDYGNYKPRNSEFMRWG